tara:strand:+ start:50 stop:580 length:531 start_codon:yes stop_codon:yes gene_type:complete
MIEMKKNVTPGETPAEITISMIDQDLKDGISKSEMTIKYGIKPWEVDEMFKHPFLKGRRPSRKKSLSFKFTDDTLPLNSGDIAVEQAAGFQTNGLDNDSLEVDPNQVTLEQAIEEATTVVDENIETLKKVNETVEDILSDSEFEVPTFEDTMDLVKEQQDEESEDELEMSDTTFEL